MKTYLRKGDIVELRCGDEKGKRGKIIKLLREKDRIRALVEGVKLAKKHQRPRGADKPGGIIDIPQPIDISNLIFICPKCGERTKLRRRVVEERRQRECRKCGEIVD